MKYNTCTQFKYSWRILLLYFYMYFKSSCARLESMHYFSFETIRYDRHFDLKESAYVHVQDK